MAKLMRNGLRKRGTVYLESHPSSILEAAIWYIRNTRYSPLGSVSNPPGTLEAVRILRAARRAIQI